MRHRQPLACLVCVLGLLIAVGGAAGAVKSVDLTGTWTCCGAGGAGAQDFVITAGTGSISGIGKAPGGGEFATITGSLSGNSVTIVTTYTTDKGYVATFTGTVSADGSTMSGTWVSNQQQSGTWTATRIGAAPGTTTTETTTAPAAQGGSSGKLLGGLNLANYCASIGDSGSPSVALTKGQITGPNDAYDNWACVKSDGSKLLLSPSGPPPSFAAACQYEYPGQSATAETSSANDAYGWQCYTTSASPAPGDYDHDSAGDDDGPSRR